MTPTIAKQRAQTVANAFGEPRVVYENRQAEESERFGFCAVHTFELTQLALHERQQPALIFVALVEPEPPSSLTYVPTSRELVL